VIFKQFTAPDVVSRWDVIQAHTRPTAQTAAQFLDNLRHRMPFPIRAVQVDGGSEFADQFELACQRRGLHLFVLARALTNPMAPSNAPTVAIPRTRSRPARSK
jgi:putative transposase